MTADSAEDRPDDLADALTWLRLMAHNGPTEVVRRRAGLVATELDRLTLAAEQAGWDGD